MSCEDALAARLADMRLHRRLAHCRVTQWQSRVCLGLPPQAQRNTDDPASIAHASPAALRLTFLPAQLLWRRECRRCRHRCDPIAVGDGHRECPPRHGANRDAGVHGNGERQYRSSIPAQPRAR
ncbi:hypothetical protein XAC3810_150055 [Xanthomonas citri pv. citri]|uniref:Uncharacterized protein n=1 Tax=Xanthomonas citri pv. citri TaxID=611301 RepID=A0A0U5FCD3_XANCI|nr:hypothetical protein XAC3824_140055 [Xanthomonas citri pv. citri]CEE18239.1 hypothetical protein XAC9322_140197 [Xanthomonas citri pv. citri]CEE19264.1 hypothetical protein XAC1083_150057 [Xanthomonas citri pv. citri]CEE26417.1 hypothetical protein XAC902_160098 [Xanthomonas citri pv. citri]CEE26581.1 hypothetical protein XAC2911_130057 [Xanthomonas citri pv. citri]